jgi:hypothetical protein
MSGSLDKFRTPNTNKAMGIEIECFFLHRWEDDISIPEYTHVGFFYAHTDASINTPSWRDIAREFVSQPLSAPWLKKEIHKLSRKLPTWSTNESCGVHIHVSRKWLSDQRAQKIWDFVKSLPTADFYDFFGRKPNEYCLVTGRLGATRYQTINTTNTNTIEFRMFKSGDPKWCCYCVDMVEYLINNANQLNISAVSAFRDQYKF